MVTDLCIIGTLIGNTVIAVTDKSEQVIVAGNEQVKKSEITVLPNRGRDVCYQTPPAQIRTRRITSYGSYLG